MNLEKIIYDCIHSPACVYFNNHSWETVGENPRKLLCRNCSKDMTVTPDLLLAHDIRKTYGGKIRVNLVDRIHSDIMPIEEARQKAFEDNNANSRPA